MMVVMYVPQKHMTQTQKHSQIAWFPGKMCLCVAALVKLFITGRWFYPPPPTLWQPSLLDLHHARYSPGTDSWSTDVAPLSSPRSGVCLVAMDGYLYAIGGHDGITAMNTVERYCSMSAPKDHYLTELIVSLVLYSLGTNETVFSVLYLPPSNAAVRLLL